MKYIGRPRWDTGISPPELLAFLRDHPAGRALDLGCGSGTNQLTMAQVGWQVTGVDYALRAVWAARQKLKQSGYQGKVISGDVTGMRRLNGPFDLVLDIGCYHGIPQQDRAAYRRNLLRWLVQDGYFLLYVHLVESLKPDGFGFDSQDERALEEKLVVRKREESKDRWDRRAAWLTYQKDRQI
jgi:2-polyprenyl-3-methyl-5-hydroxy-6-metoxy-1,4-benzoquinol methylase